MSTDFLQEKMLDKKTVSELNELLRQLKISSFTPLRLARWRKIIAQKDVRLFVVREEGKTIGMAMLRWHELTGGRVGTIEDVVVDEKHRGMGYGTALMETMTAFAKKQGIAYIELTSRPERVAANKLYEGMGWKKRETNVYRLTL